MNDRARIVLQPLVRVHGRITCSALGESPERTNVKLWIVRGGGLGDCPSPRGLFSFHLPPGAYRLCMTGDVYERHYHDIEVKAEDGTELDLGAVDVEASRIAELRGETAPEPTFVDCRGFSGETGLAALRGKWVLLVFWVWNSADSSSTHFPSLIDLYESDEQARSLYEIIAIHSHLGDPESRASSVAELAEKIKGPGARFWDPRPIGFPVLIDPDHGTEFRYGVRLNEFVLVDPQGTVLGKTDASLSGLKERIREEKERLRVHVEELDGAKDAEACEACVRSLLKSPYAASRLALSVHAARCGKRRVPTLFEVLGRIGGAEIRAVLSGPAGLGSKAKARRIEAATALGATSDVAAAKPLLDVLSEEKLSAKVAAPVCLALGRVGHGQPDAVDALLSRVKEPNAKVRAAVAEAVGLLQDENSFDALERFVTKDRSVPVRCAAVRGLGHLRTEPALELIAKVRDGDTAESVRVAAERVLAEVAGSASN